jgi:mannose-6-phosphate isomerase-like protein (cupin superfamily)
MSHGQTKLPGAVRQNEGIGKRKLTFLNGTFLLKVSSDQTAGALCVFDTIRSAPGGPPLHIHHGQDEWFLVSEGSFNFRVGETVHHLGPGDSILGPRGVPHAFRNTSQTGRMLIAFQPAGSMEAFFEEGSSIRPMTATAFAELSARHGMTVIGPPLG